MDKVYVVWAHGAGWKDVSFATTSKDIAIDGCKRLANNHNYHYREWHVSEYNNNSDNGICVDFLDNLCEPIFTCKKR